MRRLAVHTAVIVVLAVVASATPADATAAKPPAAWDERLLPIVRAVEQIRGLHFEHPVEVEYLDDAAFSKRVGIDQGTLSKEEKASFERGEAQLRAIGLVPASTDLLESTSNLQESGVLAYYSPTRKRVTVRGKELDVATRVTLAHELTHALQDQQFDLTKMQRAASRAHAADATRALVEGDAVRVQRAYVDDLSDDDQDAYEKWQRETSGSVDEQLDEEGVPEVLSAFFQSPYALGPEMLRFFASARDEQAIDDLFRAPARSDLSYLAPASLLADGVGQLSREGRLAVTKPRLADGEQQDGKRDTFGAFALYLMLSTVMDPVDALSVVDGWGADATVTFTRDGKTCIRATFVGQGPETSRLLHDAVDTWARSGAHPSATVQPAGNETILTACDEGDASVDPGDAAERALVTVILRNTLLAEVAGLAPVATAQCTADTAIADPTFAVVRDASLADPSVTPDSSVLGPFQRRLLAIVDDCGGRS